MKSRKRKRSSSSKVVTGITLTVNQRSKESNDVTREDNDELSTHSTNTDDDDDKGGVFDGTPGVFELQQNPLRETKLFQALTMSLEGRPGNTDINPLLREKILKAFDTHGASLLEAAALEAVAAAERSSGVSSDEVSFASSIDLRGRIKEYCNYEGTWIMQIMDCSIETRNGGDLGTKRKRTAAAFEVGFGS